jgi:hypothetical protein
MSSLPVLVLNSGSSSIKFSVYEAGNGERTSSSRARSTASAPTWASSGSRTPTAKSWWIKRRSAQPFRGVQAGGRRAALRRVPCPGGHRPSHGLRRPTVHENQLITPETDRRDRELQRSGAAAHAHRRLHHARGAAPFSRRPNFAILDTYFHRTMPEVVTHMPIPEEYSAMGVRRYGLSRHLVRVDRLPVAAQRAGEAHRGPPRQRRFDLRHPQRQVPRHLDGPHAHRRHHQRHAHRRHRSRRAALFILRKIARPLPTLRSRRQAEKPWSARNPACWA